MLRQIKGDCHRKTRIRVIKMSDYAWSFLLTHRQTFGASFGGTKTSLDCVNINYYASLKLDNFSAVRLQLAFAYIVYFKNLHHLARELLCKLSFNSWFER